MVGIPSADSFIPCLRYDKHSSNFLREAMRGMVQVDTHLWLGVVFLASSSALSPNLRSDFAFVTTPTLPLSQLSFPASNRNPRQGAGLCRTGVHGLRLQMNPDEKKNPLAPKELRAEEAKKEAPRLEFDLEAYQFGFRFAEAVDDFQGSFQANFRQGIPVGSILSVGFVALLLSGQLNWLFGVVNFLLLTAFIVPVALVVAVNLWVKTNIVNGECPTCGSPQVMFPKSQAQCFQCGTPLLVENGVIVRASQYNTRTDADTGQQTAVDVVDVDVKAVEVEVLDPKDP